MKTSNTMTFGCDIGDCHSHVCALDADGEVVLRQRIPTSRGGFQRFFGKRGRARVVFEAGTHSPWVNDVLTALGHEPLVANPRNLQLITRSSRKSDVVDAEMLARLGRADPQLLSPIRHRSNSCRKDLALLRTRNLLVQTRAKLILHVRGSVKPFGGRISLGRATVATFAQRAAAMLPPELAAALTPVLEVLRGLSEQIKALDKVLTTEMTARHPEADILQQVDGVGPVTALTFVLTLEDPRRFRRSRQVGAYLGLRPRRSQSGGSDPELHISKCGDRYLRTLLVQCAQYMLGPFGKDSDLRRFGLALASKGKRSAKKKAVIAVARRLAVLLHRLWVTGQPYQPCGYAQRAVNG